MEMQQAREILAALADGRDPATGKALPSQDSCNQAQVVRALYTVLAALPEMDAETDEMERGEAQEAPGAEQASNAGEPWTLAEEALLRAEYQSGMSCAVLAKKHRRTRGAIASRLVRLGVIACRRDAKCGLSAERFLNCCRFPGGRKQSARGIDFGPAGCYNPLYERAWRPRGGPERRTADSFCIKTGVGCFFLPALAWRGAWPRKRVAWSGGQRKNMCGCCGG